MFGSLKYSIVVTLALCSVVVVFLEITGGVFISRPLEVSKVGYRRLRIMDWISPGYLETTTASLSMAAASLETATAPPSEVSTSLETTTAPMPMRRAIIPSVTQLLNTGERYVIMIFYTNGGLANHMFQYAAVRAIAEKYKAKTVISKDNALRKAFNLDAAVVPDAVYNELKRTYGNITRHAPICCTYADSIPQGLFANSSRQIEMIAGYMQSFRYFKDQDAMIRREFTFHSHITEKARHHVEEAKMKRLLLAMERNLTLDNEITYVGVHVRHGDIAHSQHQMKHGHKAATAAYLLKAVDFFRSNYSTLMFIIASDDMPWVENIFSGRGTEDIYLLKGQSREVDMATLILCNHTIASTGTFSWWIAYLTNGTTTYYSDWPVRDSDYYKMINKTDYFPAQWIAME